MILKVIICLLPIVYGLSVYDRLPELVPSHWNAEGFVDGYSSRAFAVFFLPLFMAGIELLVEFAIRNDPKHNDKNKGMFLVGTWFIPVLSILISYLTYAEVFGRHVSVNALLGVFIGGLFVLIGYFLPKTEPNYTMGIRTAWTLNSEENWRRTHQFAGKLWIVSGLLMAVLSVSGNILWALIPIFVASFGSILYSYLLYRQGI